MCWMAWRMTTTQDKEAYCNKSTGIIQYPLSVKKSRLQFLKLKKKIQTFKPLLKLPKKNQDKTLYNVKGQPWIIPLFDGPYVAQSYISFIAFLCILPELLDNTPDLPGPDKAYCNRKITKRDHCGLHFHLAYWVTACGWIGVVIYSVFRIGLGQ